MTPHVHSPHRPGQMTSVMRAAARPAGSRALRVAMVRGGKIVDERVLALGEHLTVGPTERSVFVVGGLRAGVRLLEWTGTEYRLHSGAGMSGRVAIGGEVMEMSGARAPVALDDEARGRIAIGDAVVLFHFVEPAVAVARPQLPLAVKQGVLDGLDWKTTCVAAFSFLVHFGAVGALYSDFADTEIQDDGARVAQLVDLVSTMPPPLVTEVAAPEAPAVGGAVREPTTATAARNGGRSEPGGHPGAARPSRSPSDARAMEIARMLEEESGRMLATIGGGHGGATDTVTAAGPMSTDMLDGVGREAGGTRTTGNPLLNLTAGMAPVRPGGGRGGILAGAADGRRSNRADDSGNVIAPRKPVGVASIAPPDLPAGKLPDAGRVVAGLRGMLRACYKRALDEDPTARGSVRVTATVGPNGEVRSTQAANAGLPSGMVGCVTRVVQGAQFSQPEGGAAVVAIPMTFMPQ